MLQRPALLLLAAIAAIATIVAPGRAVADGKTGAGTSLGVGMTAYAPAPVAGPRVQLPTLEVAIALPWKSRQLRFRSPILESVYHGLLRDQTVIELDVMVVGFPGGARPAGKGTIRAVIGPWLGFRIQAGHEVVQPGVLVGGRLGGELMSPAQGFGFFFGVEPLVHLYGGSAGPERTTTTFGGGALFTVAMTGYRKP
ncbi:MAG: hypothetical protein QGH45_10855 [Myxococcota bacterium]|jgi:hypothetical protein|nr:hypothetical protein [Myxococcota bacterium]